MRPLLVNEEIARKFADKVFEELKDTVLTCGKIDIPVDLYEKKENAVTIHFTEEAWKQMTALIDHFSSEVGWCGVVDREDETHFAITKILVYPQTVTGVTVNTDQAEYSMWLMQQDDFDNIHMQAHSHVNMAVSPSGTDITDQERMIDSRLLNPVDGDYFIFMIWNKSHNYYAKVVDFENNVVYEKEDIKVTYDGFSCASFLEDAKKICKEKTAAAAPYYGYNYGKSRTEYSGYTGYTSGQNYAWDDEDAEYDEYGTMLKGGATKN